MLVTVVNDKDEVIGVKERNDVTMDDIYRASALWLTNSKGQVLMARRAFTKKINPGKWGPACAGTIEEGEEYEGNIIKEAEEELGLKLDKEKLELGPKLLIKGKHLRFFCQWFMYEADKEIEDFTLQEIEVAEIKWFTKEELRDIVEGSDDVFLETIHQWVYKFI